MWESTKTKNPKLEIDIKTLVFWSKQSSTTASSLISKKRNNCKQKRAQKCINIAHAPRDRRGESYFLATQIELTHHRAQRSLTFLCCRALLTWLEGNARANMGAVLEVLKFQSGVQCKIGEENVEKHTCEQIRDTCTPNLFQTRLLTIKTIKLICWMICPQIGSDSMRAKKCHQRWSAQKSTHDDVRKHQDKKSKTGNRHQNSGFLIDKVFNHH